MTTLLLPCAGLGSRLGQPGKAKALTLISGKPILGHILDKIGDLFNEILIVSSPEHEGEFLKYLATRSDIPTSSVVIQATPLGSLNAVTTGSKKLKGDCVVVWGDQIGVSKSTIEVLKQGKNFGHRVIVPIIFAEHPYVWLNFSSDFRQVLNIGRQRDRDSTEKGWADLGVFYFSNDALRSLRSREGELTTSLGERELDLTYAIPMLTREFESHFPIRTDTSELLAINTPSDLRIAEASSNE